MTKNPQNQGVQNTNSAPAIVNPYKANAAAAAGAGTAIEAHRAQVEVMTSYEVAKRFPRVMESVGEKVLAECARPTLAELAVYSYAKGGNDISGPTIRLMEAIARAMGNLRFGWQVLDSNKQKSTIRAFAYDLESNTVRDTTFDVRHWRDLKVTEKNPNGGYAITDERDIYELCANMAMRRVRSCLQGLVPRELIDMAVSMCEETNKNSVDTSPEGIAKILRVCGVLGINRAMIEARFQNIKLEAMKPVQIVALRKNIAAIRDGLAKVEDFFDTTLADKAEGDEKPAGASETKQPDLKAEVAAKQAETTTDKPALSTETANIDNQTEGGGIHEQQGTAPRAGDMGNGGHIEQEKPDPAALERIIRDFAKKATTADQLRAALAEDFVDGLLIIKTQAAGAYATLKPYLDNRLAELEKQA